MSYNNILLLSFFILFSLGCKKKTSPILEVPSHLSHGYLILNEGLFQQNNSKLGWYDRNTSTYTSDFFEQKANRSLGDTGNDMQRYGGKIYVVVNVSSTLEILDASSGNSIKQIMMQAGGQAKQPRYICFSGSKAYISCYDGFVDVLDTSSLTITNRIQVGLNPEGLAISGTKLFVANSGGLNSPTMDSTISVIDLQSESEITKIPVGLNPSSVVTDPTGEIYVITRGNYSNIPSRLHRINATTLQVAEDFTFDINGITPLNNSFIYSYNNASSGQVSIGLFDPINEQISNPNFIQTSGITTLYGITYLPTQHQIICFDAMDYTVTGKMHFFNENGTFLSSIPAGLNPSKIIVYD